VVDVDDDAVTLATATGGRVPLDDVDHGKVVLPW
jgi:hypothetical protein